MGRPVGNLTFLQVVVGKKGFLGPGEKPPCAPEIQSCYPSASEPSLGSGGNLTGLAMCPPLAPESMGPFLSAMSDSGATSDCTTGVCASVLGLCLSTSLQNLVLQLLLHESTSKSSFT